MDNKDSGLGQSLTEAQRERLCELRLAQFGRLGWRRQCGPLPAHLEERYQRLVSWNSIRRLFEPPPPRLEDHPAYLGPLTCGAPSKPWSSEDETDLGTLEAIPFHTPDQANRYLELMIRKAPPPPPEEMARRRERLRGTDLAAVVAKRTYLQLASRSRRAQSRPWSQHDRRPRSRRTAVRARARAPGRPDDPEPHHVARRGRR